MELSQKRIFSLRALVLLAEHSDRSFTIRQLCKMSPLIQGEIADLSFMDGSGI
jgi:hypothetical protein